MERTPRACWFLVWLAGVGCGSGAAAEVAATSASAGGTGGRSATGGAGGAVASGQGGAGGIGAAQGQVTNVSDAACPNGSPPGASCKQLTVTGCPNIAAEAILATVAVVAPQGNAVGTIVHFAGGGGKGFEQLGAQPYAGAGFRQVFVSWQAPWEQTSAGIKAGGCRPATVLAWIFAEPTLHASSRAAAFCGQGFSGGSGQLGYALAHYGMADILDYVNELSGPPFARIDLGCDGNAPATATVCGVADTMRLPAANLDPWENDTAPNLCGAMGVSKPTLDRWKSDSIAVGGVYSYPKTDVEFFDCTNQATAVTAMAQIDEQLIAKTEGQGGLVGYHCFSAADGCQGENLGSKGQQQAIDAMLAGCKPRHQ